MKKYNVGLFVPHAGCPNQCSFCNQKSISGQQGQITEEDVKNAAETALKSSAGNNGEIAFFGGSFTAIDRDYMIRLLSAAKVYIDKKLFSGIRISTRPDKIDEEICDILKRYNVTSVELGCQSMNDEVLKMNKRGHTSEDVVNATNLLKKYGFEVGHQMMTGLYGSDYEKDLDTARKIIDLKPDTVRIYPTIVLEGTKLCELYKTGEYKVMSGDETVSLCAELLEMFYENNIRVIRTGLHSGGNVEEGYIAGFYHPAFKELCESEIYYKKVLSELEKEKIQEGRINIYVPDGAVSAVVGQKKCNTEKLRLKGYLPKFTVDETLGRYEVRVKEGTV